jgi:hypothetical protein
LHLFYSLHHQYLTENKKEISMPKNHIFSNFRGGARRVRPPLGLPLVFALSFFSTYLPERQI